MNSSIIILPADDGPPPRRVYVASPLSTYHTPRYEAMLAHIAARFPAAEILPARDLFGSTAEWRARWPQTLASIDAICVFPDESRWVGRGVWTEVRDAAAAGLPVWVVADDGIIHTLDDVRIISIDPEDWRQYALLAFPGDRLLIGGA